ncbi:MAG: response regulator [Pyrinomonadaceae bacterium]|nr:response regulator [Pyrinomonadaceae bacterium]
MPKTILIVEDYDDTRELMRIALSSSGYNVIEAINGVSAIEKIHEKRPDLIFMDIAMPEMDGITATRIIRNEIEENYVPIICLTAHSQKYYQEAIDAGCDEVITKPFDPSVLMSTVTRYLP